MKKICLLFLLLPLLILPVHAEEFSAPDPPASVRDMVPEEPETFGEGLWYVIRSAVPVLQPSLARAGGLCLCILAASLLGAVPAAFPAQSSRFSGLLLCTAVSVILLAPSGALIQLGISTVNDLSEYGKLLLPVLTGAMAAQGGVSASAALYAGSAFFTVFLAAVIRKLTIPLIYLFLCLSAAGCALGQDVLIKFRDFLHWLMVWSLKLILYIFTGYIGITGIVSGSADAAALKAAKLTISGMIPVVGGILSDASEAVLVGAGVMKSAAGISGMLAVLAICLEPILKTGVQYLMLKITSAVSHLFAPAALSELTEQFSSAMGILLAATGTMCLMLLISTACFMKGAG